MVGNFAISERNLNIESDNQITYYAGPIKIEICGWNEEIKISCKEKWAYLLEECIETAKEAWELEDNQIFKENNLIKIKYNFKNIKLYIEHAIILS